mgnify:CR=1 FL=1
MQASKIPSDPSFTGRAVKEAQLGCSGFLTTLGPGATAPAALLIVVLLDFTQWAADDSPV